MPKLTTLCLTTSLLFLVSCGTSTVKNFDSQSVDKPIYKAAYFSDPAIDYVYKAHISVYGKDFGGIFIAKKISDDAHRVVFTTEFGNTLFDFEITATRFHVNSILDALDRKMVINTLERDFRLLLKEEFNVSEQFSAKDTTVYKSPDGQRFNYLFTAESNQQLLKIVHATTSREKIMIRYLAESSTLADTIIIDHSNMKLRIELNRMTE